MARPASSVSAISSTPPTSRWCATPIRCGASSKRRLGGPLLHVTGILEIGPPDGVLVTGTLAAARLHGLRHEVLPAAELMRRFPAFKVPADYVAVLQPEGGFLEVEPALAAHVALATAAGAELRTGEAVRAIEPRDGRVGIVTDRGTIEAGAAIIATGAWTKSLLPALPLRVTREVTGWFEPTDAARSRPTGCRCSSSRAGTACTTASRHTPAPA